MGVLGQYRHVSEMSTPQKDIQKNQKNFKIKENVYFCLKLPRNTYKGI